MATIGAINVLISANTASFDKKLKEAQKQLSEFGEVALSAAKWITGIGVAATGAAAVGLGALAAESLKSIDTANDLSQELQTNINDLRAYGYAAQVNGSSVDDFNASLRKMQKTLGEASSGDQGALDSLNALGLSIDDLKGRSATENFKTLGDAILRIKDPAEQAAASIAVFGKSGQGMLNTFAGLDEAANDFRRIRGELSSLDVANVALANDKMDEFKNVLGAVGDTLASEVAPYITGFLTKLEQVSGTGNTLKQNISNAFETVVKWAIKAGDAVDIARLALSKMNLKLAEANYLYEADQEARTYEGIGALWNGNSAAQQKAQADAAIATQEAMKRLTQAQNELNEAQEKFNNADFSKKVAAVIGDLKEVGTVKNTGGWFDDMDGGNASFDSKAGENSRNTAKNIGKTINDAIKASEDWDKKVAALNQKNEDDFLDREQRKQEAIEETAQKMRDSLKDASEQLSDYGKELIANKFLTSNEREKLAEKKALELAGSGGTGSARAIDTRNLNIEGLRQNQQPKKQEVTDPIVASKLQEVLNAIKQQSTVPLAG